MRAGYAPAPAAACGGAGEKTAIIGGSGASSQRIRRAAEPRSAAVYSRREFSPALPPGSPTHLPAHDPLRPTSRPRSTSASSWPPSSGQTLAQAVRSVFAQRFGGRIQVLVGIDRWQGDRAVVEQLRSEMSVARRIDAARSRLFDVAAQRRRLPEPLRRRAEDDPELCGQQPPRHLPRRRQLVRAGPRGDDARRGVRQGMGVFAATFRRRQERRRPAARTPGSRWAPAAASMRQAQGGFVDTNCFFIDTLACNDVFPEWAMTRLPAARAAIGRCSRSCAAGPWARTTRIRCSIVRARAAASVPAVEVQVRRRRSRALHAGGRGPKRGRVAAMRARARPRRRQQRRGATPRYTHAHDGLRTRAAATDDRSRAGRRDRASAVVEATRSGRFAAHRVARVGRTRSCWRFATRRRAIGSGDGRGGRARSAQAQRHRPVTGRRSSSSTTFARRSSISCRRSSGGSARPRDPATRRRPRGAHRRRVRDRAIGLHRRRCRRRRANPRRARARSIYADCEIGSDCVIGPNAVVGWVGLSYHDRRRRTSGSFFPHLAGVRIGDGVDVGAQACICRGMLSHTTIGADAKIGSLVYVSHGVDVGARAWLSAGTAIAGHATIGAGALLGIGSVVVDNVELEPGVLRREAAASLRDTRAPAQALRGSRARGGRDAALWSDAARLISPGVAAANPPGAAARSNSGTRRSPAQAISAAADSGASGSSARCASSSQRFTQRASS